MTARDYKFFPAQAAHTKTLKLQQEKGQSKPSSPSYYNKSLVPASVLALITIVQADENKNNSSHSKINLNLISPRLSLEFWAGEPDVGLAPTLVIISNRTINWQEMCVGLRLGFKLLSCQAGGLTIRSCLLLVLLAHRSQIHGRISEKCRFLQSLCQKISSLFCKLEEHWLSGYCLFLSLVISLSSFLIFWGKSGSCLSLYSFSCAVYALLSMEPGFP